MKFELVEKVNELLGDGNVTLSECESFLDLNLTLSEKVQVAKVA